MKFNEFEYKRPDYDSIKARLQALYSGIERSKTAGEALRLSSEADEIRDAYSSMRTLASIRYCENTLDGFYSAENDYFDQNWPLFAALNAKFYDVALSSPFREDFEGFYGTQFMMKAALRRRCTDEAILAELRRENSLVSENSRLTSGAAVPFMGKTYTLSALSGYLSHRERETRKAASEAYFGYFDSIGEKTDDYYDRLVKLRHGMAKKLGFASFVEMGYARLGRVGYDEKTVSRYRSHVEKYIVPLASELVEKQKLRLGIDDLQYYDETVLFPDGNPSFKGSVDEEVEACARVFGKLSPEASRFFSFMKENELLDLVTRPGKDGGAFSSFIGQYGAPFIYANFNGTADDATTLTHEAGHAYQQYSSRGILPSERAHPSPEAAEVYSTSMEFFAMRHIDEFFGDEADRYRYIQVEKAVRFIPYAAAVDEFQQSVYENPFVSPAERRRLWRDTERKYMPWRRYDDNPYLESGAWWHRQGHIFSSPFYYIDYALARTCAFAFLKQMEQDGGRAWRNYERICSLGGTLSFVDTVAAAEISSPFDESAVRSIAETARKYLK